MQNQVKKKEGTLRIFNVGLVGASQDSFQTVSRIFNLTGCRTRSYNAKLLPVNAKTVDEDIDILILCTRNPNVVRFWEDRNPVGQAVNRPMFRVARSADRNVGEYCITVPINPSRLIKQLDQYTIKELRYFPEFEIGDEATKLSANTVAGLKLLKTKTESSGLDYNIQNALVVDDSLAVRRQIEIEFSLVDTKIDSVASAEEAIAASSDKEYDIIFLDVVMPGMDGYAACKKIKKSPLNKNTPVILLTSRSSSFDKFKGTLAGCDSYLVKPINHNDFIEVLDQYFSNS